MAKRISIINFKGGVGKTTLAFHLGTGLAWLHKSRVLLIDMDHQSSLSILCLEATQWQRVVREGRLVNRMFQHLLGSQHQMPGEEIIIGAPMKNRAPDFNSMDIIPASLNLDDIEIELTATHQGNAINSEWN